MVGGTEMAEGMGRWPCTWAAWTVWVGGAETSEKWKHVVDVRETCWWPLEA